MRCRYSLSVYLPDGHGSSALLDVAWVNEELWCLVTLSVIIIWFLNIGKRIGGLYALIQLNSSFTVKGFLKDL